jgi:hypothetical protein
MVGHVIAVCNLSSDANLRGRRMPRHPSDPNSPTRPSLGHEKHASRGTKTGMAYREHEDHHLTNRKRSPRAPWRCLCACQILRAFRRALFDIAAAEGVVEAANVIGRYDHDGFQPYGDTGEWASRSGGVARQHLLHGMLDCFIAADIEFDHLDALLGDALALDFLNSTAAPWARRSSGCRTAPTSWRWLEQARAVPADVSAHFPANANPLPMRWRLRHGSCANGFVVRSCPRCQAT